MLYTKTLGETAWHADSFPGTYPGQLMGWLLWSLFWDKGVNEIPGTVSVSGGWIMGRAVFECVFLVLFSPSSFSVYFVHLVF